GATGTLVVAFFLASVFTPGPSVVGYWTSVLPGVGPADAIVVLGAGASTPPGILDGPSLRKALYGIRLYRRGLAPLLVFSGGADDGDQRGEVSLRVDRGRELGVAGGANEAETGGWAGDELTTHGAAVHVQKLVT